MTDLLINLLGPFKVSVGGGMAAVFESDKVRALLSFLAVERSRLHRREALAGLLWPDQPERTARTNLRRALVNLRQVVGDAAADPPFFEITRQTIQFNNASSYYLDVEEFYKLVETSRDSPADIDLLENALNLVRGNFLEGFSLADSSAFEEWQLLTGESIERELLNVYKKLAAAYEDLGLAEQALRIANQHLSLDPWNEAVHRRIIRLLGVTSRRGEAISHYEKMAGMLKEELGVEPEKETKILKEKIASGVFEQELVQIKERAVRGYILREKLGAGSFGVVYRAYQPAVKRDVAIKIIRPEFANQPDFIRRFDVEAEVVARLEHPHIVPLYDYWREPDGAFLVMRWFKGGSLRDALLRGPWHLEAALSLLEQLSEALDAAHRQGIIHRDIKPANILLDGEGHAFLSDFGIAMLAETVSIPGLTAATLADSKLNGTPEYISPEQARKERLTVAADIYALATVAYELITGHHPFADTPPDEVAKKHASELFPPASTFRSDIPQRFNEIIQEAAAKDPKDRFPEAVDFAAALRSALTDPWSAGKVAALPRSSIVANPYKGLRPFQEVDSEEFFGRESLVSKMLTRLALPDRGSGRFLAVVGPSGSGKSSVVKAGLIPAIRRGQLPESDKWFITEMVPGGQPYEELEAALLTIAARPQNNLLEILSAEPGGIRRAIRLVLPDSNSQLLLLIDQFEELFAFTNNKEVQASFLDGLSQALSMPHSQLNLIITMRADYYDRPLQFRKFGQLLQQSTEVILPLSSEEMEKAISGPAREVGLVLEEGLSAALIGDIHQEPGALPLLQYALTELFEHKQDQLLTLAAFEKIGRATGAIGKRAEELYLALNEAEQEATRQIFLRLVVLGQEAQDSRRRSFKAELTDLRSSFFEDRSDDLEVVIEQYGRYRLLTFDRDPITRAPTVEIAHEALIREWPRFTGWIKTGREYIEQYQRMSAAAAEWLEAGRDSSFLLRGARLDALNEWASTTSLALTPIETSFLEASAVDHDLRAKQEIERRQREKSLESRTKNLRLALVAVLILALLGAAVVAVIIGADLTSEVAQAITSPIQPERITIAGESTRIASLTGNMVFTIDQGRGVAFSPDGRHLLVSGFDNNATIRDALTGEIIFELEGHRDQVNNVAYSDDGLRVATTSMDDTMKVWNADTGQLLQTMGETAGELVSPALSPDGQLAAATNYNDAFSRLSAHVWNVDSGEDLWVVGFGEYIGGLDFHPNGRHLAIPGEDGKVSIWDIETGKQIDILYGDSSPVLDLAFSQDGQILVTAGLEGAIRVFEVDSNDLLNTFRGRGIAATGVDISSDQSMIAAAMADGSVHIYNLDNGREIASFWGHSEAALNVAFSPDGLYLASGADDNTTVVWRIPQD